MKKNSGFAAFGAAFGIMWVISAVLGFSTAILIIYILYMVAMWLSQNVH